MEFNTKTTGRLTHQQIEAYKLGYEHALRRALQVIDATTPPPDTRNLFVRIAWNIAARFAFFVAPRTMEAEAMAIQREATARAINVVRAESRR